MHLHIRISIFNIITTHVTYLLHYNIYCWNSRNNSRTPRLLVAVLCWHAIITVELETYQLIRNLVIPHKPANKSFKQLIDLVQAHYSPSHSVIVQRLAFNKRVQREGETAAEFVAELRKLSEQCQFGGFPQWDVAQSTCVWGQRRESSAASVGRARPHLQEGLWIVPGLRIGWEKCEGVTGRAEAEPNDGWSKCHDLAFQGWWQKASIWSEMLPLQQHTTSGQGLLFQGSSVSCLWQNRLHCKGLPHQGQHSEQSAGRQEALPWFGPTHISTDCWGQAEWDGICPFLVVSTREAPIRVTVMLDQVEVAMEVDTGASISVMSERVPSGRHGREAAPICNPLKSVWRHTQESPLMPLDLSTWTWNTTARENHCSSILWLKPGLRCWDKIGCTSSSWAGQPFATCQTPWS